MENGYVLGKLEIQDLISMLMPNEVQAAREKLKIFVKEYSVIGPERLAVLAYLIGEKTEYMQAQTFRKKPLRSIFARYITWARDMASLRQPYCLVGRSPKIHLAIKAADQEPRSKAGKNKSQPRKTPSRAQCLRGSFFLTEGAQ